MRGRIISKTEVAINSTGEIFRLSNENKFHSRWVVGTKVNVTKGNMLYFPNGSKHPIEPTGEFVDIKASQEDADGNAKLKRDWWNFDSIKRFLQ